MGSQSRRGEEYRCNCSVSAVDSEGNTKQDEHRVNDERLARGSCAAELHVEHGWEDKCKESTNSTPYERDEDAESRH